MIKGFLRREDLFGTLQHKLEGEIGAQGEGKVGVRAEDKSIQPPSLAG